MCGRQDGRAWRPEAGVLRVGQTNLAVPSCAPPLSRVDGQSAAGTLPSNYQSTNYPHVRRGKRVVNSVVNNEVMTHKFYALASVRARGTHAPGPRVRGPRGAAPPRAGRRTGSPRLLAPAQGGPCIASASRSLPTGTPPRYPAPSLCALGNRPTRRSLDLHLIHVRRAERHESAVSIRASAATAHSSRSSHCQPGGASPVSVPAVTQPAPTHWLRR